MKILYNRIFFAAVILSAVVFTAGAQNYNMNNTSVTTCSGNFYDSGGSGGNYLNNENFTMTFTAATAGQCLQFTFSSFNLENNFDFLTIYDGPNTGSPVIGVYSGTASPGIVTSSTGSLTFRFTSDISVVYAGWSASIACVACPPPPPPVILVSSGGTTNICNGNFYDSGGNPGNYSNNEYYVKTLCSNAGNCIRVSFTSFNLENGFDFLNVYDGPNLGSPLIGAYTGAVSPGVITSSSGCLTFEFTSDIIISYSGFAATISCVACPPPPGPGISCGNPMLIPSLPYTNTGLTTCGYANDYTSANACGSVYMNGQDFVFSYNSPGNECISVILNNTNAFTGVFLLNGCPNAGGTTCLASSTSAVGNPAINGYYISAPGLYYIIVDTWPAPPCTPFDINVYSSGGAPPNDLPCNATPLPLGVNLNGNNNCSGGGGEPAAPPCWFAPNTLNTVWFSVVAPASGQLRIRTTNGTLFNTQIDVYSGTCSALTYVACNDDAPSCGFTTTPISELILTVTPFATYFIRVDGYDNNTGTFGILAIDGTAQLPPIYGQECSVPLPVCNSVITVGDPGFQAFGNTCDFIGGSGNCLLASERGSAWYEIQIQNNGNLNFDLIPNDYSGGPLGAETDYDFAIWKTSGTGAVNCTDILNGADPIRCNYDYLGVTGLSPSGNAPPPYPGYDLAYEIELPVLAGEIYLLHISNWANSTSGFTMNFNTTVPASTINYTPAPPTIIWTGGIDDDWFKPENWGGCAIPSCTTNAVVAPSSSNQPSIYAAGAIVKTININPGANLSITPGFTLEICQDYINNGTLNASATSTVVFNNAAVNQNMDGNMVGISSFGNVTVNKTGGSVTMLDNAEMKSTFLTSNVTSSFNANGKYHKVGGDFINNGTYTPGAGTLEMNGGVPQLYSNPGNLNNMIMNHSSTGVTLFTNMNIGTAGTLTLNNGKIITTNTYEVNVLNTAPASVTPGNISSYVEGYLRRWLSGAAGTYDFPVGNAATGYQRANVWFTTATTIPNLRANFNSWGGVPVGPVASECVANTYSVLQVLNHGYWQINASANPNSGNYTMTLYNRNYTNASGAGWTVTRAPTGAGPWSLSGTCWAGSTAAVTVRNGMNGFSAFATAQSQFPLPVELLSFNAEAKTDFIELEWVTASEQNNSGFYVERSIDGNAFYKIGWKEGAGNSTVIKNYLFDDREARAGIRYYYRLLQTDMNGNAEYSHTVSAMIRTDKNVSVDVFPNPAVEQSVISAWLAGESDLKITLFDQAGKEIISIFEGRKESGQHSFVLDRKINSVAPGIYMIRVETENEIVFERIAITVRQ